MAEIRLYKKYMEEVIPQVQKKFGIENHMAVPKLTKIVVNMGVGDAIGDAKILEAAQKDMAKVTGQKPLITKSKKAISNFKLREDLAIGCKVTLRRTKMYEFMDRLVNFALPRIRDFRGVPLTSFDGAGNYTMGLEEQTMFPEIETGRLQHAQGMNITFVFDKGTKEQTYEVLSLLGMPFRKK